MNVTVTVPVQLNLHVL